MADKEKSNIELATKIVENLAKFEQAEPYGYVVTVDQIGHAATYVNFGEEEYRLNSDGDTGTRMVAIETSEDEARQMAINDIAAQLDDERIVLSGDWESNNL
jgi:hypothetical protein